MGVERLLDLVTDHNRYHNKVSTAVMVCLTKEGKAATWEDIKVRDSLLTRYPQIELTGCKYSGFGDLLAKLTKLPEAEQPDIVLVYGEEEKQRREVKVKHLKTRVEETIAI